MKRFFLSAAIMACSLLSLRGQTSPSSPSEGENPAAPVPSEAHRLAASTARLFTGEGFRLREGEWSPLVSKGTPVFLKVTLFTGVEYGFAAASPGEGKIAITLFDASGKEVKTESRDAGGPSRVAVRIAPKKSGVYFVKLELVESPDASPTDISLVYTYK
jgi:hypothetical protein